MIFAPRSPATAPRPAGPLSYRPDIDGLRAVAIVPVVVFHAFPGALRGGFIGVDIFFVISGFLISSILFKGLQRGDFSFGGFYASRARRIFPALIAMLAACYAAGWLTLLPDQFEQLGKHMLAGAGFVQNFVLWREAGYFDTASELKPLMHLWSLAIEEQFYLLYPLIVWGAWRLRRHWHAAVPFALGALALLSFGANAAGIGRDAVGTFFAPHTRFWELLTGGLLAYAQLFGRATNGRVTNGRLADGRATGDRVAAAIAHALSLAGLLLIASSLIAIHPGRPFPGWWALAPVAGAALLIAAGPQAVVNRHLLASRLAVWIGLISYPLYLWHWPLLSFMRILVDEPSFGLRAAAVAASVALAWLSYRLIEKPIRFGRKTLLAPLALATSLSVVALLGAHVFQQAGYPSRMRVAMSEDELAAERARYWQDVAGLPFGPDKTNVVVFGDSQAHDLFQALKNEPRIGLLIHPSSHQCSAFFAADAGAEKDAPQCRAEFDSLLASPSMRQADVLIYSHLWRPGFERAEQYRQGVDEIRARNPGIRIYFFGSKPLLGSRWVSINVIARGHRPLTDMNAFLVAKVAHDESNAYVAELARQSGVVFVDVQAVFCRNGCVFHADGEHSYFDQSHWTHTGARRFFERLSGTDVYRDLLAGGRGGDRRLNTP